MDIELPLVIAPLIIIGGFIMMLYIVSKSKSAVFLGIGVSSILMVLGENLMFSNLGDEIIIPLYFGMTLLFASFFMVFFDFIAALFVFYKNLHIHRKTYQA